MKNITTPLVLASELARDDATTHGYSFAASRLRKKGYTFRSAYWLLFGRSPRR